MDLTLKSSSHLSFTADMNWNDITAGTKRFTTREYGGRIQLDFSTRLSSSLFAQYNNRTRQVNVNARIHFIPRTGSDFISSTTASWTRAIGTPRSVPRGCSSSTGHTGCERT